MREKDYIEELTKFIKDNFLFVQDCIENDRLHNLNILNTTVNNFFNLLYKMICSSDLIIKTQGHLGAIENESADKLLTTNHALKYMLFGDFTIDLIKAYNLIKNNEPIIETYLFEGIDYVRVLHNCKYCNQHSLLKFDNENKQVIFENNVENCKQIKKEA